MNKILWLRYIPAILCMSVIFYLSSRPGSEIKLDWFRHQDKVIHAIAYTGLAISLALTVPYKFWVTKAFLSILLVTIATFVYGVGDECHQLSVPGRMFDPNDLLADLVGAIIGSCLYKKFGLYKVSRRIKETLNGRRI